MTLHKPQVECVTLAKLVKGLCDHVGGADSFILRSLPNNRHRDSSCNSSRVMMHIVTIQSWIITNFNYICEHFFG